MVEPERHFVHRVGWLRAAVLGANDGIVSTASLIIGVAAAEVTRNDILIAGAAGLMAGAMSMAAGEYVSVSSQADTEHADLARERRELHQNDAYERAELADIYIGRGLSPELASEVADQLMAHDALAAHARDELGITEIANARPVQAALASAATFSLGAGLPLVTAWLVPLASVIPAVSVASLLFLALLGAISARTGGASMAKAAARVTLWGALAMVATALVGYAFGTTLAG